MNKEVNPKDYIEFMCHGVVHYIEKSKIRNIFDEPRMPNTEQQNPEDKQESRRGMFY